LDLGPGHEILASVPLHVELEELGERHGVGLGFLGRSHPERLRVAPRAGRVEVLASLRARLSDRDAREGPDRPAILLVLPLDPVDYGEGAMPLPALPEAKPRDHRVTPLLPVLAFGNAETAQGPILELDVVAHGRKYSTSGSRRGHTAWRKLAESGHS